VRGLIIDKYKNMIDLTNGYWKGWGDKDHLIKQYPNFESMTDEELLNSFLLDYWSCQPMG